MFHQDVHNNVEEMKSIIKDETSELKNCIIQKHNGLKYHIEEKLKPMAVQQKVDELFQGIPDYLKLI